MIGIINNFNSYIHNCFEKEVIQTAIILLLNMLYTAKYII